MGLGGILAALAQGFGGGMVKVADEAWKKDAEDRKYKFYSEESQKDRDFKSSEAEKQFGRDKETLAIKHSYEKDLQNDRYAKEIGLATHKSKLSLAAERARMKMSDQTGFGRIITDGLQATAQYTLQEEKYDEAIAKATGVGASEAELKKLYDQKAFITSRKHEVMNNLAPIIAKNGGEKERALLESAGYRGDWGVPSQTAPVEVKEPSTPQRELPEKMAKGIVENLSGTNLENLQGSSQNTDSELQKLIKAQKELNKQKEQFRAGQRENLKKSYVSGQTNPHIQYGGVTWGR